MLAIVVSRADDASVHIGEHLRDLEDWSVDRDDSRSDAQGGGDIWRLPDVELREFDTAHLELEDAAEAFDDPDLLVFASKHAGDTGKLLTAHHTGNFGPAEYGGADHALARACPAAHRRVVQALGEHAPDDYEIGMECTHHGPTEVGVPSMFVEVGSAQPQWDDPDAARAVAKAILDLRGVSPDAPREDGTRRHLVGFGGGHYVPRFERIVRETDWAVGHIAADWCLDAMGDPAVHHEVIRATFEESAADFALLADERPGLRDVLDDLGFRVVDETFLRETTGVSLDVVERVEDALGSVESGTRLGEHAADFEGGIEIVPLPGALREQVQGIDQDEARTAVERHTVGFETEASGTRLGERVVVTDSAERRAIIETFATILESKYDEVEIEDDTVVAHETAFVPEKARALGISEGPTFGKLSAGQSVEVGGRTIPPEAVHEQRVHRFPI